MPLTKRVLVSFALFVWLISHQAAVLFFQNKSSGSNQPTVLFSQNKSASAISHQPNEQAVRYSCPVASGAPKMVCKNIVAAIMLPDTLTYIKDLISNTMLFMLSFSRRMESQYLKNTSLFVLSKQPASHRRTLLGSSPLGRLEWRLHRAASALPPPPPPPCRRRRGRPGTRAGPRDGGSGAPFKALRPLRGGGGARRTTAGHGGGGGGEDVDLASLRPDPVTPGRIYGGRR
jgi:hypothetical protein